MDCLRLLFSHLRRGKGVGHPFQGSRSLSGLPQASLAAGLLLGLGCVQEPIVTPPLGALQPKTLKAENDDAPKRDPKAATCIAFGDFNLRAADDDRHSPAEKERINDRARRAYQQALKQDPKNLDAYHGLIRVYENLGNQERVVATYQEAMKALPKVASLRFDLGMYYAQRKEWTPAVDNLKTALTMDEENPTYVNTLAFCLARAGRYDESFECFRKSVGEAQAHYNVARMLHHLNEDEACKKHLRLALQAKPDLSPAQQLLSQLESSALAQGKSGAVTSP
jgi:tetratricopeptide (TPR) repeat protein